METLEFGVKLTLEGNLDKSADNASRSVSNLGNSVEQLGKKSQESLSGLLGLQSSLFVLHKFASMAEHAGFTLSSKLGGGFFDVIKSSAEFQQSLSQLRIIAGKSFDFSREKAIQLANDTNLSTQSVIDVAQRLLGVGLTVDQVFKKTKGGVRTGIEDVAAAISRLSGPDRTRALNGIANMFTDINSFQKLLNIAVPQAFKEAYNAAATESQKFEMLLGLLDKRFGKVFGKEGIGGDLLFNVQRAFQIVENVIQQAMIPAINLLTPLFQKLFETMSKIGKDKTFTDNLTLIATGLVKMVIPLLEFGLKLLDFLVSLIKNHPNVVKFGLALSFVGGILLGLTGFVFATLFSLALFGISLNLITQRLFGVAITTGLWDSALFVLGRTLNAVTFGQLAFFGKQILDITLYMRGAIAGSWSWAEALGAVGVALGAIVLRFAVIFAVFEAIKAIPDWLDRWKTGLGAILNIIQGIATIAAGIIGFFLGGPLGAVLGSSAMFAFLNSMAPTTAKKSAVPAPETLNSTSTDAMNAQAKALNESLEKSLQKYADRPININNTMNLDGDTVHKSNMKKQKQQEDRFGLNQITPP